MPDMDSGNRMIRIPKPQNPKTPKPKTRKLVPHRLAALQHTLYPLQRLLLATKRQEGFTLQVQQVLFGYHRGFTQVAAAHDIGEFLGHHGVVVRRVARAPHAVDAGEQGAEGGAAHADVTDDDKIKLTFSKG